MMITIERYDHEQDFPAHFDRNALINFLHTHLDQFGDTHSAIGKCLDYAFSDDTGKGGFVLVAWKGTIPVGAVVMINSGMSEYIPEHFLVYIAVNSNERNQGIGKQLMERSFTECPDGDIALHVEYENPAKRLYERTGFTTKYAEMRRVHA